MVAVLPPALLAPDTDYIPTKAAKNGELRTYLRLVGLLKRGVQQPAPSAAAPVLLVPGFIAGDMSLALLARHLRRQGHRTFRSGLGANLGCTDDMVQRLVTRMEEVAADEGRPVALVGHSRGGMIAKLAALRRPDLVAALVVLSAPVTGTLAVSSHVRLQLEWLFRLNARGLGKVLGADCVTGECAARIASDLSAPLPAGLPYVSIYSTADGIIDWHTCLDPDAELIEVESSHSGMGTDPKVRTLVAGWLAAASRQPVSSG